MREACAQATAHTVCFARRAAIKMGSGPGHDTLAIIQLLQKQPRHTAQTQLDAVRLSVALGQVRLSGICITLEIPRVSQSYAVTTAVARMWGCT